MQGQPSWHWIENSSDNSLQFSSNGNCRFDGNDIGVVKLPVAVVTCCVVTSGEEVVHSVNVAFARSIQSDMQVLQELIRRNKIIDQATRLANETIFHLEPESWYSSAGQYHYC